MAPAVRAKDVVNGHLDRGRYEMSRREAKGKSSSGASLWTLHHTEKFIGLVEMAEESDSGISGATVYVHSGGQEVSGWTKAGTVLTGICAGGTVVSIYLQYAAL